jgi:hypothetical protein
MVLGTAIATFVGEKDEIVLATDPASTQGEPIIKQDACRRQHWWELSSGTYSIVYPTGERLRAGLREQG